MVERKTPLFDECLERPGALDICDLHDALSEYLAYPSGIPIGQDLKVKRLLEKFECTPEFLQQFGYTNPAVPYTRNLVASTPSFDLILLVWNGGQTSPIHAHAGSNCWLSVIKGDLVELFYAPPKFDADGTRLPLEKLHEDLMPCGTVGYINDRIGLHAMGSGSPTELAYSLHLYSPPYQSVEVFDEFGNCSVRHICFHTKFGERTDL